MLFVHWNNFKASTITFHRALILVLYSLSRSLTHELDQDQPSFIQDISLEPFFLVTLSYARTLTESRRKQNFSIMFLFGFADFKSNRNLFPPTIKQPRKAIVRLVCDKPLSSKLISVVSLLHQFTADVNISTPREQTGYFSATCNRKGTEWANKCQRVEYSETFLN